MQSFWLLQIDPVYILLAVSKSLTTKEGDLPSTHLLPVLPAGGVEALYEVGGVAQEHGVAGGPADHAEHGQPHVSQRLGGEPAVADTEHVGHGLHNVVSEQL